MNLRLAAAALLIALAGCSTSPAIRKADADAMRHVALGDSLLRLSFLREATLEYNLVAERYPSTSVYAPAVRRAALLYCDPANPSRDDSAAIHWFGVYLALPLNAQDREVALAATSLLERIISLRLEERRADAVGDSLAAVTRRQSATAAQQARRIQELEVSLQQANDELTKLREVDVRLSKTRIRK